MKRILIQNAVGVKAVAPQEASADVTGAVIDRDGAREAVVTLVTGAVTGTPTSTKVKAVITHGDKADGSDQVAVTGLNGKFESVEIGGDAVAQLNLDLEGLKRYVRVTADVVFAGGTTPKVGVAATAVLGNWEINPEHRNGANGSLVYGSYAGDGKGYNTYQ